MATRADTKPRKGAANIMGVWKGVLLRIYRDGLAFCSLCFAIMVDRERQVGLTCGTLLHSNPAILAAVTMLLPATRATVGRRSKEAGQIDSQLASAMRVEL